MKHFNSQRFCPKALKNNKKLKKGLDFETSRTYPKVLKPSNLQKIPLNSFGNSKII